MLNVTVIYSFPTCSDHRLVRAKITINIAHECLKLIKRNKHAIDKKTETRRLSTYINNKITNARLQSGKKIARKKFENKEEKLVKISKK